MEPADWWEDHFEELIKTERALTERHENRAQVLAGLCAAVLGWSLTQLHQLNGLSWLLQLLSILALVFSVGTLALVAWPLERGRFAPGSVEERVWRALLGERSRWAAWFGVLESPEARLSAIVAEETRKDGLEPTQSLASAGARAALEQFLRQSVYTDLGWWLVGEERVTAVRLRLVFRWWGLRQGAYVKMMLVQVGMRGVLWGMLLLVAAVGLEPLGWLALLPLLAMAGLWLYHRLDFS